MEVLARATQRRFSRGVQPRYARRARFSAKASSLRSTRRERYTESARPTASSFDSANLPIAPACPAPAPMRRNAGKRTNHVAQARPAKHARPSDDCSPGETCGRFYCVERHYGSVPSRTLASSTRPVRMTRTALSRSPIAAAAGPCTLSAPQATPPSQHHLSSRPTRSSSQRRRMAASAPGDWMARSPNGRCKQVEPTDGSSSERICAPDSCAEGDSCCTEDDSTASGCTVGRCIGDPSQWCTADTCSEIDGVEEVCTTDWDGGLHRARRRCRRGIAVARHRQLGQHPRDHRERPGQDRMKRTSVCLLLLGTHQRRL